MRSPDIDPTETQEWLEALAAVIEHDGQARATFIVETLQQRLGLVGSLNTPYCNTLPSQQGISPADEALLTRIEALIRWNALALIIRSGRLDSSLGGHIGTFASACTLYEVGFQYFWHAETAEHGGDLLYIQGHSSPGLYARAYLEGRLTREQLVHFRRETTGKGLSSYPHPWLMPDFWQFPTVSMGLGPIQAIYQARLMKYLQARQLAKTQQRRVWCFCGDGEMDEPESVGALAVAGRERLDNLIFVINCNLQRLDGPVRGNGKIIQELERLFVGADWHVIKVVWGTEWDTLFAKDKEGRLQARMEEVLDGQYQEFKAHGGAYEREHFFGTDPAVLDLVSELTDEQISALRRGGHDPQAVYQAYEAAVKSQGKPVVILAKTIKGYGLGEAGESLNTAHNTKKMTHDQLLMFRDRFDIPLTDEEAEQAAFYCPPADSPEAHFLHQQRQKLGGYLPQRRMQPAHQHVVPPLTLFQQHLKGSGDREISTTMAFVRMLVALCKDKEIGRSVVPIVPDESRTFGMEGLFRQFGIYAPTGQLYTPVDAKQVMYYKETADGQILQEGLNEAGAFCSWLAAATAYSTHNTSLIPFYIYYSMFGFQRIGDLAYAAGDARARGFLIGATSGRTTLNGEGLQHEDGHSHILAQTIPNCISYDPAYTYELAVIIQAGLKRMLADQDSVFYYITTMNENYRHPAMPDGVEEQIIKGMYCLERTQDPQKHHVQLLGCGAILNEVRAAVELLQESHVSADVWSVTSFNELAREGQAVLRHNKFTQQTTTPYITACLHKTTGPIIAATDYMKVFAEQVRAFVPRTYLTLGTDGFGLSDTRANLRAFFEVDRYHIVVTALYGLYQERKIDHSVLECALKKYNIKAAQRAFSD